MKPLYLRAAALVSSISLAAGYLYYRGTTSLSADPPTSSPQRSTILPSSKSGPFAPVTLSAGETQPAPRSLLMSGSKHSDIIAPNVGYADAQHEFAPSTQPAAPTTIMNNSMYSALSLWADTAPLTQPAPDIAQLHRQLLMPGSKAALVVQPKDVQPTTTQPAPVPRDLIMGSSKSIAPLFPSDAISLNPAPPSASQPAASQASHP